MNNLVLFDKATYDKLCKEVPNYKLITPAVVSERLKIRGSLARAALQELLSKGTDAPHSARGDVRGGQAARVPFLLLVFGDLFHTHLIGGHLPVQRSSVRSVLSLNISNLLSFLAGNLRGFTWYLSQCRAYKNYRDS